MIVSINLLPYRPARRLRQANFILASWGATAVATVAVLFLVHFQVTSYKESLDAKSVANEATIASLEQKLGEVKDIRELKKFIEMKLKIVETLSQARNLPVRLVDETIRALPEKIWLNGFNTAGPSLKLVGMAQSNAVVADFMRNLGASPFINNVKLDQVQQNESKMKVKTFSLSAGFAVPVDDSATGKGSEKDKKGAP